MTNTLENKTDFLSLYRSVPCINCDDWIWRSDDKLKDLPYGTDFSNTYASLKPLSQISDHEAIEVAKIVCPEMFQNAGVDPIKIERHNEWLTVWRKRNVHSVDIDFLGYTTCQNEEVEYKRNSIGTTFAIDFLRSHGYALPFMGISVETLVEWVWVKLKGGNS